jgi:hypothetical protein
MMLFIKNLFFAFKIYFFSTIILIMVMEFVVLMRRFINLNKRD